MDWGFYINYAMVMLFTHVNARKKKRKKNLIRRVRAFENVFSGSRTLGEFLEVEDFGFAYLHEKLLNVPTELFI